MRPLTLPLIASLTILILSVAGLVILQASQSASTGTLQVFGGSVSVERGTRVLAGKSGTRVRQGDTIQTRAASRVAVIFADGSLIRLEADTEATLVALEVGRDRPPTIVWRLTDGRLWSTVAQLPAGSRFEVETPTIVAAVQGTRFGTDVRNQASAVYVAQGTVGVGLLSTRTDRRSVPERSLFSIRDEALADDFAAGPVPVPPDFSDDWIRFNEAEDAELSGDGPSTSEEVPVTTPEENLDDASEPVREPAEEASVETVAPPPAPVAPRRSPAATSAPPTPAEAPATVQAEPAVTSSEPPGPTTAAPAEPTPPAPSPPPPPPTLVSLVLAAGASTLEVGQSTTLTVTARSSDGTDRDVSKEATFAIDPASGGHITGTTFVADQAGSVRVSATYGGLVATVTLSITAPPPPQREVQGLRVSCSADLRARTAQCHAVALYTDDTTEDVTSRATWSLAKPANGTITQTGFYTAGDEGSDTIVATYGGKSGSVTLTL